MEIPQLGILAGSQGDIGVPNALGIAADWNDNIGAGLLHSKGRIVDHGLDAGAAGGLIRDERLQSVRVSKYGELRL